MTTATTAAGSPGAMLRLIRTGQARSRADLVHLTGASRSTVSVRVEQLIAARLVREGGTGDSTGGRPPKMLAFNSGAGCILAVDLGVTSIDVAVTDLSARFLGSRGHDLDIALGPDAVLTEVTRLADEILADIGRSPADLRAIGIGLPGPVEFATGRPVQPPVMPGWHDVSVPDWFRRYDCPVYVDNDVNVMAAAEVATAAADANFLVVKVGTGIGCGIVVHGRVYRGTQGSAGDIGHIWVPDERRVTCGCGNENCLEALAGGAALARDAAALGLAVRTPRDLVELAVQGDPVAVGLVRDAGRRLGDVLAGLVNFFNPSKIVITGGVAHAGAPLLAGIREVVYRRSLPLAARSLEVTVSDRGEAAGRLGAAVMAIETHFGEERVDALLAG